MNQFRELVIMELASCWVENVSGKSFLFCPAMSFAKRSGKGMLFFVCDLIESSETIEM